MNYRKGTLADIEAICVLFESAKRDMDAKEIYQWDDIYPIRDDYIEDISKDTLYIAENEIEIVGVYVISEESDEAYDKCSWQNPDETACILHRLCVNPKYQNHGLGREILLHIESQAKNMSYESIRLDVYTKNPHALNLYRMSNYEERGYADWRKGRFILMEKAL